MLLRAALLALVTLVALAAGPLSVTAEDDTALEVVSLEERPLDLAARLKNASGAGTTHLTVDVSIVEFITLQRLAPEDRQRLFGLAPGCQSRMTASSAASARPDRVLVVIACAP
jgi:hypothetical protein